MLAWVFKYESIF